MAKVRGTAWPDRCRSSSVSAVIDIDTVSPDSTTFEVGASLFTSSFLGEGTYANGRGSWLASVRRGNLDLLIDARGSDVGSPRYVDALAKVDYELDSAWSVHAGALVIDDEISLEMQQHVVRRHDSAREEMPSHPIIFAFDLVGIGPFSM